LFFFFSSPWQWWAKDLLFPLLLLCRRWRLLLFFLSRWQRWRRRRREDGVDRAGSRFLRFSLLDAR
jgi:hypothetical protein